MSDTVAPPAPRPVPHPLRIGAASWAFVVAPVLRASLPWATDGQIGTLAVAVGESVIVELAQDAGLTPPLPPPPPP